MKYIFTICLLYIALISPINAFADSKITEQPSPVFFSMLQDIPLMSGLKELTDHAISFDKAEGRIIESLAIMHNITKEQVLGFYQSILPQFGWGLVSENSFFRNNEFLEITFEENNNNHLVKIMIKPTL